MSYKMVRRKTVKKRIFSIKFKGGVPRIVPEIPFL